MSIVKREFVWNDNSKRSTRYGIDGWLLTSMPNFDPCHRDYVVMHDTFEHQPDDKPDIEHEMMAFGALAFIRVKGLWDVFDNKWDANNSLSADVNHFLDQVGYSISVCEDVTTLHPELTDEFIHIRKNCNGYNESCYKTDGLTKALFWISKGYARAQARWEGHSSAEVCRMLESTLKELKAVTGRHNIYNNTNKLHPVHGSKLSITFNTSTLKTIIKYDKNPRKKFEFPVAKAA